MKLILLILGFALCGWAQQPDNSTCTSCHDVDQKVSKSAHQPVACATCHLKHEEYPHPANVPKPACQSCHGDQAAQFATSVHSEAAKQGKSAPDCSLCHGTAHETVKASSATFRTGVVETCGMCHDKVSAQFQASVHGKAVSAGNVQAPVCTDCHGEHAIQKHTNPNSSVFASHVPDTCGRCHGDVRIARHFNLPADRVTTFQASYHGLALKSGMATAANCSSCHGIHNILPSADPKSMVNKQNLRATCGKCHQGAGEKLATAPVHAWGTKAETPWVIWIRRLYQVLIPAVLGFMLVHNLGDWLRKLFRRRIFNMEEPMMTTREVRMLPQERWMHLMLLTSFITLSWTGFALLYPGEWWAKPLLAFEGKWPVRGWVHRGASVAFMFVSVWHVYALITNRKLREHWLEMLPTRRDLPEIVFTFLYNVGLRKTKPILSSHSYIAKMEYWAVVWGAIVMVVTGGLLWANSLVLRFLGNAVTDIATAVHFYEAVLAAAAIVIWHFYFVFADPDVYPMDTAWLTGVSARKKTAAEIAAQTHAHKSAEEEVETKV